MRGGLRGVFIQAGVGGSQVRSRNLGFLSTMQTNPSSDGENSFSESRLEPSPP